MNLSNIFIDSLKLSNKRIQTWNSIGSICSVSIEKSTNLLNFFKNLPNSEFNQAIIAWLELCMTNYISHIIYSQIERNKQMNEKIIESTKKIEQIYFENKILAESLLKEQKELEKFRQRYDDIINKYNLMNCVMIVESFFSDEKIQILSK